jgi:hypothetical protein
MATEQEIEKLALQYQAQGPDEFPFGYFKYLAKRKLETGLDPNEEGDE